MSAIAQSVSWWCFVPEKLTPKEFVRAAADAGYLAVDLVPPEYFSLVADHGLKIAAIAGHKSLTVGLNKRDQHVRIKKEIEARLADLVRYGIPNLICFAGNRDGLEDSEGIDITAEGLALLARLGYFGMPEGELAPSETPLRYLSHADHGGRYYSYDRIESSLDCSLSYCRQSRSKRLG
jgi:sugar phosphate isomerase/epimerase